MTQTINCQSTSNTSYCSPLQFLQLYDWRLISQLVSDTGVADTYDQVLVDPNLQACLMRASSILESACAVGGRYSAADLNEMLSYNGGVSVGSYQIIGIVAGLTLNIVKARRGETAEDDPGYKEAIRLLELIKQGDLNLSFLEPETTAATANWSQFSKLNLREQGLIFNNRYFAGVPY